MEAKIEMFEMKSAKLKNMKNEIMKRCNRHNMHRI